MHPMYLLSPSEVNKQIYQEHNKSYLSRVKNPVYYLKEIGMTNPVIIVMKVTKIMFHPHIYK